MNWETSLWQKTKMTISAYSKNYMRLKFFDMLIFAFASFAAIAFATIDAVLISLGVVAFAYLLLASRWHIDRNFDILDVCLGMFGTVVGVVGSCVWRVI